MSVKTLGRRVGALENSVPIIDDLSDYVLWQAHGRDHSVRWDPVFKQKLEEAFTKTYGAIGEVSRMPRAAPLERYCVAAGSRRAQGSSVKGGSWDCDAI